MARRSGDREKTLGRSRAELHLDDPSVRERLDHLAEELAKEYISLMKETAAKPGKREE